MCASATSSCVSYKTLLMRISLSNVTRRWKYCHLRNELSHGCLHIFSCCFFVSATNTVSMVWYNKKTIDTLSTLYQFNLQSRSNDQSITTDLCSSLFRVQLLSNDHIHRATKTLFTLWWTIGWRSTCLKYIGRNHLSFTAKSSWVSITVINNGQPYLRSIFHSSLCYSMSESWSMCWSEYLFL